MQVKALPLSRPSLHLVVLVRPVVVRDQVDVNVGRHLALDMLQELQPLHMCVLVPGAKD